MTFHIHIYHNFHTTWVIILNCKVAYIHSNHVITISAKLSSLEYKEKKIILTSNTAGKYTQGRQTKNSSRHPVRPESTLKDQFIQITRHNYTGNSPRPRVIHSFHGHLLRSTIIISTTIWHKIFAITITLLYSYLISNSLINFMSSLY